MKKLLYLLTTLSLFLQPAIASSSRASAPQAGGSVLAVEGTIRYVDADANGANNGSTWADAFTSLQSALEAAVSGDQVWVAEGTYTPTAKHCGTDERFKSFQLKNGVPLYGGFDPSTGDTAWEDRDWVGNPVILSGDIGIQGDAVDNSRHVFCHPEGLELDASAVLDGFNITAGNADGSFPHDGGGGMLNYMNSSPTLTNITFSGNTAAYGGGIFNEYYSNPNLTYVTFSGNTAYHGGGMFNENFSSPTLTNVTFFGNTATNNGGGMENYYFSSPTLRNITFSGNTASNGGGMYNDSSSPSLTNATFSGNTAKNNGGGMYNDSSSSTLTNVTFSGNTAINGGGMYNYYYSPTLTNAILWGNTPDQIYNTASTPMVTYSDIQRGYAGTGNIDSDPQFIRLPSPGGDSTWGTVDDDYGDLRLQPTSLAIDAGNNAAVPAGITTDLADAPRFANVPSIPDTGAGNPPIVDMGAYEVQVQFILLLLPLIMR